MNSPAFDSHEFYRLNQYDFELRFKKGDYTPQEALMYYENILRIINSNGQDTILIRIIEIKKLINEQ